MDKISITSTYRELSLYAKVTLSGPNAKTKDGQPLPAVKPDDGGTPAGTTSGDGSALVARSQDGDTFTLSVEARAIQVSRKITIESSGKGDTCGKSGESGRMAGDAHANALMDALDQASGHSHKHHKRAHGHFPQLGDAEDLAARLREHWDREHAQKGGSRGDFADQVRQRLAAWDARKDSSSSSRVTVSYQEFRTEVSVRISASLDAWSGADAPGSADTDEA